MDLMEDGEGEIVGVGVHPYWLSELPEHEFTVLGAYQDIIVYTGDTSDFLVLYVLLLDLR